jgi:chromosome segregation ATPase
MNRPENGMEEYTDLSEETTSILSIVQGLEGQIDTAFKLKELLESDLDDTRKKLSEELAARAELDAQVKVLESQSALAEQLREDIAFVEEERNKFANMLAEAQPQLQTVTQERDSLAEQLTSAQGHAKQLEGDKMALEAQVMNFRDKVADMDRLRADLAQTAETRRDLGQQIANISSRLEASESSKNALEANLAAVQDNLRGLRGETEDLRNKLAGADNRSADLRSLLEEQQTENATLAQTKARLESETKTLNINYQASKAELEAAKKALRDIRSEAIRASGRIRQRYLKPSGGGQKTASPG